MALKVLLILIFAGLAPPVSAEGPAAPPPADEAAIRSHFAAFDAAFARGDAPGVAATYADDADVVRPGEPAIVGRAGIESFYHEMFAGRMKGVRKGGAVDRIRLVTPTVAVVDSSYTLDRDTPALHARGVSITVLEKRGGRWTAVLSRSYRVPEPTASPRP
jgi:uncharacterized protein (TIGR02246 family)